MKTYNRILGVLVVFGLISVSAFAQGPSQDQNPDQAPGPDQAQAQVQQPGQAPPPPDGQAPLPGSTQTDPPATAGRLQFMSGSVSIQPHGTDAWIAGVVNRPLTNSDNIWADKNSRAEVSVGSGLIRIDSESSLTLTSVTDTGVQLQLHQGAMYLHVRDLDGQTYEVDTPNQAFAVQKPGDYRFDVNPDADTTVVTVWQGQGQSTGNGPAVLIHENEQARFSDGTSLKNEMRAAPAPDAFDEWAQSRDQRFDHSESARYVSPNVVGSDDLDEYGSWRNSPDYGNVWVPSQVDVGWAPYRYGHWIWVAPWGWTWVEDEPWGYAPFHYGRWVYFNNYWGWAPGPYYGRPYYSPALVAFYGGRGWGVGLGFGIGGGFGWCPLGFGEPFVPWYGVSRGYFNRVNITNTRITNVNITNVYNNTYVNRGGLHGGEPLHYANLRAPNGFTAVSRDTMVNSRPVAANNVRVSPNELGRVSPVRSLDVQPTRTTMLGANAGRPTAMPPARTFARPVYSQNGVSGVRNGSDAIPNRGSYTPRPNGNAQMQGGSAGPRYVPRPPSAGGMTPEGRTYQGPNQGSTNQGSTSQGSQGDRRYSRPEPSYNRGGSPQPSNEGGRQPQEYSRPSPSSNGGSYSRPSPRSYGGSYSRTEPSNGGGSYTRSTPTYGGRVSGGGSYSSGRPSGGYSGGGRASVPSHSSGGGSRGSGGSHSSGGRSRH